METLNPFRMLKNIFTDFLLRVSGTYFGAPNDPPWEEDDEDKDD